MSPTEYIHCAKCDKLYKIPFTNNVLKITCNDCGTIFYKNLKEEIKPKSDKRFIIAGVIAVSLLFIWHTSNPVKPASGLFSNIKRNNWVIIDYEGLIDKKTITHSGENVGEVIKKIPHYHDDEKGLVQKYLEPFSILCHDVLLTQIAPDTLPLVNILNQYPVGSEQPAWVALFREGHYQIYYNSNLIRVFIKGEHLTPSFERHNSVIRHPIRDIIESNYVDIESVEIYNFNNDYGKMEISLNTTPKIIDIKNLELQSKKKSIDLNSIENFLAQGVALEAIEVDEHNDLYFYGIPDKTQTIAGNSLSLSDVAVIYRAIFHHGNNAPYISLDTHEDNRYAKVNFGGHFENTRVGSVVLEADKLFKTLSTGLDPNTHKLVKDKMTRAVPDFLTEDERNILEDEQVGTTQIRYWFYPDSIGTVTDGSIGAVLTHQFHADIERMDSKRDAGNAVRKTIKHLNKNYSQYENANKTFHELSTLGRLMALINWLNGMNVDNKVELDELLSVKIPAFKTQQKTKKMLAITVASYPTFPSNPVYAGLSNSFLNSNNVRDYTKVYYVSELLNNHSKNTTDDRFLEVAMKFVDNADLSDIVPPRAKELKSKIEYYESIIQKYKIKIKSLGSEVDKKKYTLNRYNSRAVDSYNELINDYNFLNKTQEYNINAYNLIVNELNDMGISSRFLASIGGGINLRSKAFKKIKKNNMSPKLLEINGIKGGLTTVGKISKYGKWVRSNVGNRQSIINKLPINKWKSEKTINGQIIYSNQSTTGDFSNMTISNNLGYWKSNISINNIQDNITYIKKSNQLTIQHSAQLINCKGDITNDGKRFTFY